MKYQGILAIVLCVITVSCSKNGTSVPFRDLDSPETARSFSAWDLYTMKLQSWISAGGDEELRKISDCVGDTRLSDAERAACALAAGMLPLSYGLEQWLRKAREEKGNIGEAAMLASVRLSLPMDGFTAPDSQTMLPLLLRSLGARIAPGSLETYAPGSPKEFSLRMRQLFDLRRDSFQSEFSKYCLPEMTEELAPRCLRALAVLLQGKFRPGELYPYTAKIGGNWLDEPRTGSEAWRRFQEDEPARAAILKGGHL